MSTKLSFKEALGRQGAAKESDPRRSDSPTVKVRLQGVNTARPVDLARLLVSYGLSLRKAHKTVERLARGETVALELSANPDQLASRFAEMGVGAHIISVPQINSLDVRNRFGISQDEFATRFGLGLDTVRNWEQGRNSPEPTTQLLLGVIEKYPQIIEEILSSQTAFQMEAFQVALTSAASEMQAFTKAYAEIIDGVTSAKPLIQQLTTAFRAALELHEHAWMVRQGKKISSE